jgi:hypothetical protein
MVRGGQLTCILTKEKNTTFSPQTLRRAMYHLIEDENKYRIQTQQHTTPLNRL